MVHEAGMLAQCDACELRSQVASNAYMGMAFLRSPFPNLVEEII